MYPFQIIPVSDKRWGEIAEYVILSYFSMFMVWFTNTYLFLKLSYWGKLTSFAFCDLQHTSPILYLLLVQ